MVRRQPYPRKKLQNKGIARNIGDNLFTFPGNLKHRFSV